MSSQASLDEKMRDEMEDEGNEQEVMALDKGPEIKGVTPDTDLTSSGSDSDADYDTDLDCHKVVVQDYLDACSSAHAIPQSVVLRGLGNRDLDLSHRNLGNRQLLPLFHALKDNMRVQRLILKDVGLDKDGVDSLARGLVDNVTLSFLSLAGNPIGSEGLCHVVRLLQSNKIIRSIDLSDTNLGGDAVPLLSHLLMTNTSLRFLDLARNHLGILGFVRWLLLQYGAVAIRWVFVSRENMSVEFLRLAWNHIRLSGAAAMGQCIAVNRRLRMLDLSWNGLGYQGAVALARSLPHNTELRELDISNNRIDWKGAQVLAGGLAKNSTLKTLRLGFNPLTTTGAMDLVEAASTPGCGLRLLDLTNVPVIAETDMMAASLQLTRGFRLIHGGVVFIHDILGQRVVFYAARVVEREQTPMEKLLSHMRHRMIRPLEMLREFDKSGTGHLSQKDFAMRLKRANVPLHDFEIAALTTSIAELQVDGNRRINYSALMESIEKHILQDRTRRWREKMIQARAREYNTRILEDGKPLYWSWDASTATATSTPMDAALISMSSLVSSKPSVAAGSAASASPLTFAAYLHKMKQVQTADRFPKLKNRADFTMAAPLDEIGRKKKRVKKMKSRIRAMPAVRETTTLVGMHRE
ncbi:hypothetical protein C0Q70_11660 [Pomacea canaliculata]|uniref:EF-hand domain-containing protein n=1 Tax=Pomacea canaliculata TaxID=400727 RepID=A0A2T7P6P0_POMCA|nr:hypothetical protein C0Q70_11660 [Pomacea canaliculata]